MEDDYRYRKNGKLRLQCIIGENRSHLLGDKTDPDDLLSPLEKFCFEEYKNYLRFMYDDKRWAQRLDFQDWLYQDNPYYVRSI